ncbi:MAG: acyl--CoA ligase [Gammaproteobacteria bacterium]|nr:acyl--CoA ligase [Gammaproteobacteria bacterium]
MYDDLSRLRIEASTVGDKLLATADRWPERPCLIFPESRHSWSSMVNAAYTRARSLHALGVRPGDHVGVLMPNCIEYMELVFGCSLLGAVSVLMNARYKPPELAYVVENADLKVIITTDLISEYANFGQLLHDAFPELGQARSQACSTDLNLKAAPHLKHLVMLGNSTPQGFISEQAFTRGSEVPAPIDALRAGVRISDPAIMMYTSGTTANPKGCLLSHEILVRNGINMNRQRYFMTETDVFWAPLPMFHMAAILPAMACLDAGAAMASSTHFDAGASLRLMEEEKVTIAFPSFPTITNELITHPDFKTRDLSRIRRLNNVAPVDMLKRFQDAFPQAVQTGAYGMTEVGGVISFNHPSETLEQRLDACGTPFPGVTVRVVHPETLEELPVDERGELWIKGYAVFGGYYKSPEKNAESFYDGWFRTGDLCSLDNRGAIRFHGRIKDMLKVGGENVAALEIESFLARHPAVKMAQVIGVPDPRLQEVAVAFVELLPGETASAEDIIGFCKGQLASFKVPRAVYFVTEWPMSSTKVQKFRLREMIKSA